MVGYLVLLRASPHLPEDGLGLVDDRHRPLKVDEELGDGGLQRLRDLLVRHVKENGSLGWRKKKGVNLFFSLFFNAQSIVLPSPSSSSSSSSSSSFAAFLSLMSCLTSESN